MTVASKLLGAVAACLAATAAAEQRVRAFAPGKVPFAEMDSEDAGEIMLAELHQYGLVQVSDVPGLAELRSSVYASSLACGESSQAAKSSVFGDMVERRTFATKTAGSFKHGEGVSQECATFDLKSAELGALIDVVSSRFAARVSSLFKLEHQVETSNGASYENFEQVVENGDHLDHFHSYKINKSTQATTSIETTDFHTDQGLFISFIPALMVSKDGAMSAQEPGQFLIKSASGNVLRTSFADEGNVLVFMMGNGVDQAINDKLAPEFPFLWATPHAFVVPEAAEDVWRVWFGRMFFLPVDALHSSSGVAFGEIQSAMQTDIGEENLDSSSLSIGCAGQRVARDLSSDSCTEDQIFCWMRCMDYPEDANPEYCESQGLPVKCASQYNQIWTPEDGHGDYIPMCTNATASITPAPTIPAAEETPLCSSLVDAYVDHVKSDHVGYKELAPGFHLGWTVTENNTVKGTVLFDGVAGWLAIGLPNPTGGHNGMNGAKILMAIADFGGAAGSAQEYIIDENESSFRHWSTPVATTVEDASMSLLDGCFTSMTFNTKSFSGADFDVSAPVDIIWGAHTSTWLVGYHGGVYRGVETIDFKSTGDKKENDDSAASSPEMGAFLSLAGIAASMFAL